MTAIQIPEGYLQDHRGALIPKQNIKEIDLLRDQLVKECITLGKETRDQLRALKARLFADIHAFVGLSLEKYDVKRGGSKGNLTLLSFDGRFKVLMAVQESIRFDERLQAAKHLVDECLREWTVNASPKIRALIDGAFAVDKAGNISTPRVLGLRKLEIEDEKWLLAMKAIAEAVTVVDTKSYIRMYERDDETGQYLPISLDMAAV